MLVMISFMRCSIMEKLVTDGFKVAEMIFKSHSRLSKTFLLLTNLQRSTVTVSVA